MDDATFRKFGPETQILYRPIHSGANRIFSRGPYTCLNAQIFQLI